jgi:tetratricopeptide (TPR) repeat protein
MQQNYEPAISALANLEIRTGGMEAAIGLLRGKAGSYPRDLGILNRYADTLVIARRYNDAIDVAKQALRVDERNARAMLYIGKANLRLGRTELAQAVFDQVLTINPEEAEVYFLRSFINLAEDNRAEAIANLKIVIEKRPTHVEAMNNLATQYLISGNYDAAVTQIEAALALAPSWGVLHLNHGNALRGAKRWKEAKAEQEAKREAEREAAAAAAATAGTTEGTTPEPAATGEEEGWE